MIAALVAGLGLALAPSARASAPVALEVSEIGDKRYQIDGSFVARASTTTAWDVLTDYENIPRFVSSMRKSRVLERRADGMVFVEQEAVGGLFFLTKRVLVCLEVRRRGDELDFGDRCRRHFWFYEGAWRASPADGGTRVAYHLEVQPDFPAPGFLARRAMKRGAAQLLDQVRVEIERRASAAR